MRINNGTATKVKLVIRSYITPGSALSASKPCNKKMPTSLDTPRATKTGTPIAIIAQSAAIARIDMVPVSISRSLHLSDRSQQSSTSLGKPKPKIPVGWGDRQSTSETPLETRTQFETQMHARSYPFRTRKQEN